MDWFCTLCRVARDKTDNDAIQMSKPEFASWLRQRVLSCSPAAVVRLGDGEARLLKAATNDTESMQAAYIQLKRETGRAFSAEAVLEIRAALEHARDGADVLGVLAGGALPESLRIWNSRLLVPSAARVETGKPPPALAYCQLNHEILAELPQLLTGHRVSVISCRDVKPIIEDGWGLDDVGVYQIPSQFMVRGVDDAYEAVLHDVPIWPDIHHRICSELTVREPGEVFLVGAGMFGKDLCIRIRDQGGIGLDMGSALDHIAGKFTRPAMAEMLELHAGGMSTPDIAAYLHSRYHAQIDHGRIMTFIDAVSRYLR